MISYPFLKFYQICIGMMYAYLAVRKSRIFSLNANFQSYIVTPLSCSSEIKNRTNPLLSNLFGDSVTKRAGTNYYYYLRACILHVCSR